MAATKQASLQRSNSGGSSSADDVIKGDKLAAGECCAGAPALRGLGAPPRPVTPERRRRRRRLHGEAE